jgi:hypothetical protein
MGFFIIRRSPSGRRTAQNKNGPLAHFLFLEQIITVKT